MGKASVDVYFRHKMPLKPLRRSVEYPVIDVDYCDTVCFNSDTTIYTESEIKDRRDKTSDYFTNSDSFIYFAHELNRYYDKVHR
jgi:hypothetical protein